LFDSPIQSPEDRSDWVQRCVSAMGGSHHQQQQQQQQLMSKSASCSSDGGLARKASLLTSATGGMVPSRSALHLGGTSSTRASTGELRPLIGDDQQQHRQVLASMVKQQQKERYGEISTLKRLEKS